MSQLPPPLPQNKGRKKGKREGNREKIERGGIEQRDITPQKMYVTRSCYAQLPPLTDFLDEALANSHEHIRWTLYIFDKYRVVKPLRACARVTVVWSVCLFPP